jgi:hypothetical protein
VLTSKDLTADERSQLTGKVERILQKGAYSREALLKEVKEIVSLCAKKKESTGPESGSSCAETTELTVSAPSLADVEE